MPTLIPDEGGLRKVYLKYMEHVTINDVKSPVSISDYNELKMNYRELKDRNSTLCDIVSEMQKWLRELKGSV
ncbi:MAG: hypothetical protein ACXVHW_05785 [Methanobacterium sp.]